MKMDDMIIVSVDDHIVEPADMWDNVISAQHKHIKPVMRRDPEDGSDYWMFDGKRASQGGLNAVVGRPREEYGMEPFALDQMRKGVYEIDARIDDMNVNGILASLNFPSILTFDGSLLLKLDNKEHARILCQAYNDWHIDEWCGKYPGRNIPLAILPYWDMGATAAEIARVAAKGCHAISFSDNPATKGMPSLHDDYWKPMWKACADHDIAINVHIGTGAAAPHDSMQTPIDAWITTMPISIVNSAADWLNLKAVQEYDLRVALSEGGIGWIPYFLERADFTYEHHHEWTHTDFGKKKPSDVFREHFITCFIDDKFGIKNRDDIGVDIICYECDYPHSDTLWPEAPEYLMNSLKGCTDEEIDKITHLNALKAYSFEPFKHIPRAQCTVGALRQQAKHVDTTPRPGGGNRPIEEGETRVVTSGDIMKLFAGPGEESPVYADAD